MRISMPNGTVMPVEKAIAVCETRQPHNGKIVRLCEGATDIAFANAVAFFPETSVHGGMAAGDAVLFGNLSNEFVREVLASLVQQDFVDLSDLKLQKAQLPASRYVFDNGASEAYMIQGWDVNMCCASALGHPFMGMVPPAVSNVGDAGEDDDEAVLQHQQRGCAFDHPEIEGEAG